LNDDFRDILALLIEEGARFVVVGAHAMAVHGVPRATGDLDIWIPRDPLNGGRVWKALLRFGAPVGAMGVSEADLGTPGTVLQIGVPPRRVDLLTDITGVEFEDAWARRLTSRVADLDIPFLGRADLLANKRATARPKDLADIAVLERAEGR
jgi:hypothetical protein